VGLQVKWVYAIGAIVAALLMIREALLLTRGRRSRARAEAAARRPIPDLRTRLGQKAAMPVFLVLVAVVVAIGMMVGVLVGPH
jgi:hypothetical protein